MESRSVFFPATMVLARCIASHPAGVCGVHALRLVVQACKHAPGRSLKKLPTAVINVVNSLRRPRAIRAPAPFTAFSPVTVLGVPARGPVVLVISSDPDPSCNNPETTELRAVALRARALATRTPVLLTAWSLRGKNTARARRLVALALRSASAVSRVVMLSAARNALQPLRPVLATPHLAPSIACSLPGRRMVLAPRAVAPAPRNALGLLLYQLSTVVQFAKVWRTAGPAIRMPVLSIAW